MQAWLEVSVLFAKGEEIRPSHCLQRFAKTPGGEESLDEVAAMNDDDIHIAGELAMLEAVVQKMNGGQTVDRWGFGQRASSASSPAW